MTLTVAQRLLLGIITSVEAGLTTPADAVTELGELKADAKNDGLEFRANYSVEDFEKIRASYLSSYEEQDFDDFEDRDMESELEDL